MFMLLPKVNALLRTIGADVLPRIPKKELSVAFTPTASRAALASRYFFLW